MAAILLWRYVVFIPGDVGLKGSLEVVSNKGVVLVACRFPFKHPQWYKTG